MMESETCDVSAEEMDATRAEHTQYLRAATANATPPGAVSKELANKQSIAAPGCFSNFHRIA